LGARDESNQEKGVSAKIQIQLAAGNQQMREVQHARTLRVAQLSVLAKPQQKAAANFSLATHWCGSRQKKLRVSRFPSPAAAAGEERSCRPTSTKRTAGCNSLSRCTRRFPGA